MPSLLWKKIWKRKFLHQQIKPSDIVKSVKLHSILKILANTSFCFFVTILVLSICGVIFLIIIAKDLPHPDRIVRKEGFATKIFDRNDKLIYDVYSKQKRTPVALYEVPQYLKDATVSIEDKDFYLHKGFDPRGYVRIVYYVFSQHRLIGGSTLTQQLVKNVLLSSERTVLRKVKEFILSLEIEAKYSKDQILQMYLNEAPYGGTNWGVEEASRNYFGKSVSQLSLTESAILAGFPQSPSYYSPFGQYPKAYIDRTKGVLRRMKEDGKISTEEEKESLSEIDNFVFSSSSGILKAPHFVMYVKNLLENKYGEKTVELGGLRVTTSIDLDLQDKVQKIVTEEIAKTEKVHITNGAAIVLNPNTGEIMAMVGSKNYDAIDYDGKVNVTLSQRQPGSAIKPVTYLTALKKGYTASSMIIDTLTAFPQGSNKPDYVPVNYDSKEHGPIQIRYALGNSLNIPAVKMLALVGIKEMLFDAYEMGILTLQPTTENLKRFGLSVTLGGGEVRLIDLTSAYSAFANGGTKISPISILKVTDKDGNIIEEFKPVAGENIMTKSEAFIISNILSDNSARLLTFGENSLLNFKDRQVAVKTGTTNDKRDNWAIGWSPQVISGVWVGNNDNSPMKSVASGVSGASPVWRKIMDEYLKKLPKEDFKIPDDVIDVEVDSVSGYRNHDEFPKRKEYFIKGTEPNSDDPVHVKLKLCRGQGKIATPVDIARGDYDEKEFFIFKEKDPYSTDSINRWQIGIDNWLSKQSDSKYHPPSDYCNTSNQVFVKFLSPQNQQTVGQNFSIKVEAISSEDIVRIEFTIDRETKNIINSPPYELEVKLPDGKHTIKAEATDLRGNRGSEEIKIGVNIPWDYNPSPTSAPPTPTPVPSITPIPTPT